MASDNTDDIIDQLLAGDETSEEAEVIHNEQDFKRRRLVALAAGGGGRLRFLSVRHIALIKSRHFKNQLLHDFMQGTRLG